MGDTLAVSAQTSELLLAEKPTAAVLETALAMDDGQRDNSALQLVDATTIPEGQHEMITGTVDQANDTNELLLSTTGDAEATPKTSGGGDDTNTSDVGTHAGEQASENGSEKANSDAEGAEADAQEEYYDYITTQEQLREEYTKTHPWIVDWEELDWEHFKNRTEDEGRHIIEVLRATPTTADEIDADVRRRNGEKLADLKFKSDSATAGSSWIQRIRIQSPAVVAHLAHAGGMASDRLSHIHTFLRPFTSLKALQPAMKLALGKLEERWANAESSDVTAEHTTITTTTDEKARTAEVPEGAEGSGTESESEDYPYAGMDDRIALDHLRCYVKFVDEKVVPLYDYFRDISHKKVRFNDLALLFSPGELIYWPSAGSIMSVPYPFYQPAWRVFHYSRTVYGSTYVDDINLSSGDTFHVCCYYIDHDGSSYGVVKGRVSFSHFNGEKAITDLPAYPFRFADAATRRLDELKLQGNLFRSFIKEHHSYYDGWTIPQELQQKSEDTQEERFKYRRELTDSMNTTRSSPEHVESAVVVDFDEAFKRHPRWKTDFRIPDLSSISWEWHEEPHELRHWKDSERTGTLYSVKELFMTNDMGRNLMKNEFLEKDVPIVSSRGDGLKEVADEDLVLLPRRLVAYALRDRKFMILDIFSLRSLVQHKDVFKNLKINLNHRRMIESLVRAHSERRKMQKERPLLTLNQDLVYGKGAGLFILLHGAPGVGKTATAEAIAQRYNKPLFSITCGNLGLTPREVEDELKEIFRLAHLWDCVLLLDEADIFLARRDIHSLKRNALVSGTKTIYPPHHLKVGIIDEAFKSRIHLSLYYERLTRKQMLAIFDVNIGKLRDIEAEKSKELLHTEMKELDLIIKDDKIIEFAKRHWKTTPRHARWNGRQIRNAFQIASSMARYDTSKEHLANEKNADNEKPEQPVLDDSHFELVAEIMKRFDTYFEMATGETDEQAALLDKARDDRVRNEDLASYAQSFEAPSAKEKSSRSTKARDEDSKKSRKSKSTGKGKERDYSEERRETKSTKAKVKSSKRASSAHADEKKASSSRKKAASPQRKPKSSGKPATKTSTKASGASRSSKKKRDETDEEEDDEEDDSGRLSDQASDSEDASSAEEETSDDQHDEDDDDDDDSNDDYDDSRWALKPVVPPIDLAGKPSTVLCRRCRCITAGALVSEAGFRHVGKLKDLWKTWQSCSLCHVIFRHYVDRGALGDQRDLRLKFTRPGSAEWRDEYPVGVLMLVCDGLDTKQVSTVNCLYIVTPAGDPGERLGFPPANRHLSNTRSTETFEFIQARMHECLHGHPCSRDQRADPGHRSQWPARLLYVNPNKHNDDDHIRVIDITESCPRFMTLSHCWGKCGRTLQDKDKTKKESLHQRKVSIPIKALCRNFQDAVEITRRLGVEYLWIDALCIVQDDVEDWDRESVKMGFIYQNSVLTISANLKDDGSGGCFNKRSVPHDLLPMKVREKIKVRSIEITTRQQDGQKSTLLFHYERQSSDPAPLKESPLENRGWIFQERVLSPRTIHFTPSQVVWECRQMYKLEDMLPSPVPGHKGTRSALIGQGRGHDALNAVDHWYREIVCSDYSRRVFTVPADRLVAVAGLARAWQPIIGDEYIAGIWRSSMVFGLCWMRDQSRTLVPATTERRYPTWTWASHDGFVTWWPSHGNFEADRRFRFHGESLQYRNQRAASLFSVDGGFIRVEGCVSELTIHSPPDKPEVGASLKGRAARLFVDDVYPDDFAQLSMCLLVVALGHSSGSEALSCERIGLAFVDFETEDERAEFWNVAETQQILLF
ncbi:hypothetical protein O1611_g5828 [Lasiodiplodia mahajangana]|uniref:Uncharacterized protein n=1 Tax=Lasiodiplodia mahajangana TaxID=1108764 RepID=A0ACC2JKS9_9PEZI|nr:hypothetical protein O1611_g5828 [Lasiodiplodia mahajangana]